jgi:isoleucyl-tRNA synthetase
MNDVPASDLPPARDYRDTVFLPQTAFPMRGDLPKKEPAILARWEKMDLWGRLREASAGREKFILHDGPPYANGNLHIGHALNKILKDVINRSRQMAGQDGLYIPGWDCHGLPIEWKIEEEYRRRNQDKDQVPIRQFRAECRAYAAKWMAVQATEFRRLGVEGGWAERYATMDFPSEAAIANEICKFLLNGALYRGLRPVMWSPVEKTALAEAEIEYHDYTSTTIFVRFPVAETTVELLADATVVIWTTTPWTMPGNRAIRTRSRCWRPSSSPPRPAPASCISRRATARTTSSSAGPTGWKCRKRSATTARSIPGCRIWPACMSIRPPIPSARC